VIDDPTERAAGGLPVLAQGEGWIVVAKPPRLLVHRNAFMPKADAALQRVRRQVGRRVYPIHRLDRNTSGCLLFATERERAGPLSAALSDPRSQKTYVALVRGRFAHEDPVVVDTPVKYDDETYKESRSVVRLLGRSAEPRCSLVEVLPETGRHHQVRRHVRDLHHPILHDGDHGDSRVNRWWRENRGLTRLALHCLRLHVHLDDGPIDVVSPLFEDHAAVFGALPFWEDAVDRRPELALPPLPLLAGAQ
jgi:tRNA pseudouridine65 synthase